MTLLVAWVTVPLVSFVPWWTEFIVGMVIGDDPAGVFGGVMAVRAQARAIGAADATTQSTSQPEVCWHVLKSTGFTGTAIQSEAVSDTPPDVAAKFTDQLPSWSRASTDPAVEESASLLGGATSDAPRAELIVEDARGFPFRAWMAVYRPTATSTPVEWGLPMVGTTTYWMTSATKALPIRPIPLGIAVDSMFYGAMWYSAFAWRRAVVRKHRRAKGECEGCGQELRGFATCAECGVVNRYIPPPPPTPQEVLVRSLGTAALVIAIIAPFMACVPLFGACIAIPSALAGLTLGVIAVVIALRNNRKGMLRSLCAIFITVCFLGIAGFAAFQFYKITQSFQPLMANQMAAAAAQTAKAASQPVSQPPDAPNDSTWSDAEGPADSGTLRVRILSTHRMVWTNSTTPTGDEGFNEYMTVDLIAFNWDDSEPLPLASLWQPAPEAGELRAMMFDDTGRECPPVKPPESWKGDMGLQPGQTSIPAAGSAEDMITFELPVEDWKSLRLRLPFKDKHGTLRVIQFRIPRALVDNFEQ